MNRGISILDFQPGPAGDWSSAFAAACTALADCDQATVHIPDGDFGVLRPVVVPNHVSIAMAPAARLFAMPGFEGEAVVIKGERPAGDLDWTAHGYSGRIGGGIIDGGKLPIHGVIGRWTRRFVLHDLEIFNCLAGGIRIGEQGWYETTLRGVRVQIDFDVTCLPDAIGVEVVRGSDNQVTQLLTIGYDIGVKGTSGSTCWHQVHVWKGRHRPFKIGFHCGGWNDCFSQCQVDECQEVGFLVDAPFQRFESCMVQGGGDWLKLEGSQGVAVRLTGRGTHCFFAGTFINPSAKHPFVKVFDGTLEACTVVGTLYNPHVPRDQQINQFASGTGGASWQPVVGFAGEGVRLADACAEAPRFDEGQIGEVRWLAGDGAATLYLRTPQGWSHCRMELGGQSS
jgi:hypothetical protein